MISWDSRGGVVLKIFFILFPICFIQKVTKNLAFMNIENQMEIHKIGTNRELIYEDGSI